MPLVATDSRSRFGIHWYDNEAEADRVAAEYAEYEGQANAGITQVGRDKGFDRPGMYAVVVP